MDAVYIHYGSLIHSMKLLPFLSLISIWSSALLPFAESEASGDDALSAGFENPPKSTAPATYWYWVSGMISKEGITKDLEAMASIGIGDLGSHR